MKGLPSLAIQGGPGPESTPAARRTPGPLVGEARPTAFRRRPRLELLFVEMTGHAEAIVALGGREAASAIADRTTALPSAQTDPMSLPWHHPVRTREHLTRP